MTEKRLLCQDGCPQNRGTLPGLQALYLNLDAWLAVPPDATERERTLCLPLHALRAYHRGSTLDESEIYLRALYNAIVDPHIKSQKLTWDDRRRLQETVSTRDRELASFACTPMNPSLAAQAAAFYTQVRFERMTAHYDSPGDELHISEEEIRAQALHFRDQLPFLVAKVALESCHGATEMVRHRLFSTSSSRDCPVLDRN